MVATPAEDSFTTTPDAFYWSPVSFTHDDIGTEITTPDDLLHWYVAAGAWLGWTAFIASLGIIKDPGFTFEVRDKDPSFRDLGPMSMDPLRSATVDDWVGDWRADNVTVTITRLGTRRLTVAIAETDGSPPYRASGSTTLGREWLEGALDHAGLASAFGLSPTKPERQKYLEHAAAVLANSPLTGTRSTIARRYTTLTQEMGHGDKHFEKIEPQRISEIANLLSEVIATSAWTLRLGPVVLSLYGIYQDGSEISRRIQYQRSDGREIVVDQMLAPHYDLY